MSKNDKYSPRKKKIYMTTKFLYIGGFLEFMEKRCDMTDMDNIDIYNRLLMHGKFRYDREDYKDSF
jgi:hypothetical protein